jgi:hypothetical protein
MLEFESVSSVFNKSFIHIFIDYIKNIDVWNISV